MSAHMVTTDCAEAREKLSSTDLVYRAVADLREVGRVASRKTIAELCNLPMTVVDDRVKHLKAIGKIRAAGGVAGLYEPTEDRLEDRAISSTILPTGRIKLEIGNHVLDLSMREGRNIVGCLGGLALLFRRDL